MSTLLASPHWPYIWPVYSLALIVFGGMALWSFVRLRAAAKRAREESER